jgi:hypothetical protein
VDAFRIETLVIGQLKKLGEHVTPDLCGAGSTCYAKTISAARNLYVEAAFDLPQMFIKLTAQVGKAVVIGGLENDVPRNLDSTQNRYLEPLCRGESVSVTVPGAAVNLST